MSVDGVVLCDCLEIGLAVPAPCPVIFEDGWVNAASGDEVEQLAVRTWSKTACEHPRFWLVEHQLRRMAMLTAMAEYGGAVAFPATHAAMPRGNWGSVLPVDSARCLGEIDRLGGLMSDGAMVTIVDADDDGVVFVDANSRLVAGPRFHTSGPALYGFDDRGAVYGLTAVEGRPMTSTWLGDDAVVRVVDADGSLLFAARDFVQERRGDEWIFRDEQTGATVRHCSPVPRWDGTAEEDEPHRMRAEIRPIDIDYHLAGVAEIRELFGTSVRTGRPVNWV